MKKLLSLLLSLAVALSLLPAALASQPDPEQIVKFSDMEYIRPDPEELQTILDALCILAEGDDANAILEGVFEFYDTYDWIYTCAALADIHYSADLSDSTWSRENDYCSRIIPQADQMLDSLYSALAQSPCRSKLERKYFGSGFFAAYEGESLWDDRMLELMDRENQLINQYYTQCGKEERWFLSILPSNPKPKAQILVELIRVRNEMAAHAGYDSYEAFAGDFSYYRDYSPEDMDAYLEAIRQELTPIYIQCLNITTPEISAADQEQTLAFLGGAAEAMGGRVWEAFQLMEMGELYHIAPGKNKYNASFETYLYFYYEPFLFLNPEQTVYDFLTVSHEFGHFCNDYASCGSQVGVDVSEFFSQGLEYLALCYGPEGSALARIKLLDSLATFVEQACYASFEREMYRIPQEELSIEALFDLYDRTAVAYGFDSLGYDPAEFTEITHFYTNPMYVFSYIVSNDAAMQLYQLELEAPGQGLARFEENLDTQQPFFLAFLEEADLESPFAPHRLEHVKQTFARILLG